MRCWVSPKSLIFLSKLKQNCLSIFTLLSQMNWLRWAISFLIKPSYFQYFKVVYCFIAFLLFPSVFNSLFWFIFNKTLASKNSKINLPNFRNYFFLYYSCFPLDVQYFFSFLMGWFTFFIVIFI